MGMRRANCFTYICTILALFLCLSPALAGDVQRAPTFAQCKALANPKTSPSERTSLTQLFKTNNFYCGMASAPFTVQYIFSAGQQKSQLRLAMGAGNRYVIDGKSLVDVLLPDRAAVPPTQMVMLAGQFISILGELFSSESLDAHSVMNAGGKATALISVVGVNARAAQMQLALLREQLCLTEDDIEPSFWIKQLSRIEPPPPSQTQNAAPVAIGPPWMQKLLGKGKNLLGSFQGLGE